MKQRIYKLISKGSHGNKWNRAVDYFIMSLIILSVFSIILESMEDVSLKYGSLLYIFDVFSVLVFTLEYLLRIYISDLTHPAPTKFKSALKFIKSTEGLIDLVAILPFYLPMLIKMDVRFIRMLRLTRFLRILKLNRYNKSLHMILEVFKEKKSELAVTGFVLFLILLMASFIMYYVEGDAQPEAFPDILSAFWWAIATLTTVGYGDIYPITSLGRLISGVIALLGIGLVALPTGLISAGFINKIEKNKLANGIQCPHCGEKIDKLTASDFRYYNTHKHD